MVGCEPSGDRRVTTGFALDLGLVWHDPRDAGYAQQEINNRSRSTIGHVSLVEQHLGEPEQASLDFPMTQIIAASSYYLLQG
jgi:hypothetical protein